MKIGQIQICFDKVFNVQKSFNPDFQNTKTLKFTKGNKPASVNKNESRLAAAVIAVCTNIDEKAAVKFCNLQDYKILAHHGVCLVLNSIVKSRHMVLVRLLPMLLVPTG